MLWRIYLAFTMHATVSNCHILRSSTFLDILKLLIISFFQLVELLFLCNVTNTIYLQILGPASLVDALTVLRRRGVCRV